MEKEWIGWFGNYLPYPTFFNTKEELEQIGKKGKEFNLENFHGKKIKVTIEVVEE